MRTVLPITMMIALSGCTTTPASKADECIRLLRCEMAWTLRDWDALIVHRCNTPKDFSMDAQTRAELGISTDCPLTPETDTEQGT